jgi:hypothetical protein
MVLVLIEKGKWLTPLFLVAKLNTYRTFTPLKEVQNLPKFPKAST